MTTVTNQHHNALAETLKLVGFHHVPVGWIRRIERTDPIGGFQFSPAVPTSQYIHATVTSADTLQVTVAPPESDVLTDAANELAMVADLEDATGHIVVRRVRL